MPTMLLFATFVLAFGCGFGAGFAIGVIIVTSVRL